MDEAGERAVATGMFIFVIRCGLSATAALIATQSLGLPHPVWACVSSLIVSQDRIEDTRASLAGRLFGTLVGITTAIIIGSAGRLFGLTPVVQLALNTVICAVIARLRPAWRACMWTAAIVLLTATPQQPLISTGLLRGAEVLLGGLIGAVVHELTARVAALIIRARAASSRRPR